MKQTSTDYLDGSYLLKERMNTVALYYQNKKQAAPVPESVADESAKTLSSKKELVSIEDLTPEIQEYANEFVDLARSGSDRLYSYYKIVVGGDEMLEAIQYALMPSVYTLYEKYGMDLTNKYEEPWIVGWTTDVVARVNPAVIADYQNQEAFASEVLTAVDNYVSEALSRVPSTASEVDKLTILHDYVAEKFTFNMAYLHTPLYKDIMANQSVCEGYARALKLLCDQADIPCKVVHGMSATGAHVWNQVYINGDWYESDATWDDSNDVITHSYVLLKKIPGRSTWKIEEI